MLGDLLYHSTVAKPTAKKFIMEDTSAALKAAEELVEALKQIKNPSPIEHLGLLKRARNIQELLEQPYDIITRFIETSAALSAMHTLVCLDVHSRIPSDGSTTATEIAAAVNVEASAVARLMRVVLADGFFTETAPDTYTHNALSLAFQKDALGGMVVITGDMCKATLHLAKYFRTHKPDDVFDPRKSVYAFTAGKEGLTYFEVLDEDPAYRSTWDVMLGLMDKNMPITGMFPFASLKEQVEREPERPFIVDIAGGRGQALLRIQEDIPGVFGGKLILQDLPHVVGPLKPKDIPNIEKMEYDALTPQPVKSKFPPHNSDEAAYTPW